MIGFRETADAIVGVLETRKPPPPAIVAKIAAACRVDPAAVTLLVAPTASLAGGVQIVARSVETALHKLAELKFDLSRIISAHGTAPLPPVAADDLAAIGRTNDAILYGARVVLTVTGDDASLAAIGPQVPSSSSRDHGEPFAAIFARYNNDFYAVDPHLFSPAEVVFQNVDTGKTHAFGGMEPEVLATFVRRLIAEENPKSKIENPKSWRPWFPVWAGTSKTCCVRPGGSTSRCVRRRFPRWRRLWAAAERSRR